MNGPERIRRQLLDLQDPGYQRFQSSLLPTLPPGRVLGVRTPALRKLAREWAGTPEAAEFCRDLPHRYYEEDNLHGFFLERVRDFPAALAGMDAFLPFIDNWATCDSIAPPVFGRNREQLLPAVRRWLDSGRTFTVRYGLGALQRWYLEDAFQPDYLAWAAEVRSEEYYVRMMAAWFFATALAKQPEAAWPYFAQGRLEPWTLRKAIQKALESRRITPEQKAALRELRNTQTAGTMDTCVKWAEAPSAGLSPALRGQFPE